MLFIGKGLADEGFIGDAQAFAVAVSKSDSGSALDSAYLGLSKALSDTSSVSESIAIALDYVRSFSDSGSAIEDLSVAIDKVFADNAGVSDVIFILLIIPVFLSDAAIANDDFSLAQLKPLDEQMLIAEQAAQEIIKKIIEASAINDSLSIGTARPLNDVSSSEDDAVKLTAKNENDASLVADSGTLRSQDYCEFSYFAEDYVGEFRQFT